MAEKECIYLEWTDDHGIHGIKMGELIRCKDCKHFHLYEVKSVTLSLCERNCMTVFTMEKDDYCSRGERKDNER